MNELEIALTFEPRVEETPADTTDASPSDWLMAYYDSGSAAFDRSLNDDTNVSRPMFQLLPNDKREVMHRFGTCSICNDAPYGPHGVDTRKPYPLDPEAVNARL